jgi:hypothetical protein
MKEMYKPKHIGKFYVISKDDKIADGEKCYRWLAEAEQRCDELNKPLKTIITNIDKLEIKNETHKRTARGYE